MGTRGLRQFARAAGLPGVVPVGAGPGPVSVKGFSR
jgi:hypothetical protein